MINQSTYQKCFALAATATAANLTLSPAQNTPLHELVKKSTYMGEPLAVQPTDNVVLNASASSNNAAHNESIDYFINLVADATQSHFAFARNVVTETVGRVATAVTAAMQGAAIDPISKFRVVINGLPAPLDQGSFYREIEKRASTSSLAPRGFFKFKPKTGAELTEILMTGSAVLDERITEWLKTVDFTLVESIWNNYFVDQSLVETRDVPEFSTVLSAPGTGLNASLIVHLVAQKLSVVVLPDSGHGLEMYQILVQEFLEFSANKILAAAINYQNEVENSVVVQSYSKTTSSVAVNRTVYLDWLKNGGENEVLFAGLLNNSVFVTVKDLEENKQNLLALWNSYLGISQNRFRNELFNHFLTTLRSSFFLDMDNADGEEKEYLNNTNGARSTAAQLFENELAELGTAAQEDIPRTVMRLVTKARYYYTDAFKILSSIDDLSKANPNMQMNEVVTLAHIDYLCDFVAAQIRVN